MIDKAIESTRSTIDDLADDPSKRNAMITINIPTIEAISQHIETCRNRAEEIKDSIYGLATDSSKRKAMIDKAIESTRSTIDDLANDPSKRNAMIAGAIASPVTTALSGFAISLIPLPPCHLIGGLMIAKSAPLIVLSSVMGGCASYQNKDDTIEKGMITGMKKGIVSSILGGALFGAEHLIAPVFQHAHDSIASAFHSVCDHDAPPHDSLAFPIFTPHDVIPPGVPHEIKIVWTDDSGPTNLLRFSGDYHSNYHAPNAIPNQVNQVFPPHNDTLRVCFSGVNIQIVLKKME